jgi:hypothetical protein
MGSTQDLIGDLKSFIRKHGGNYSGWYLGVSPTPRAMLFETHKVAKNSDDWIYLTADSANVAIEVISHFIGDLGTQGQVEEIPEYTYVVYAFKLGKSTSPQK